MIKQAGQLTDQAAGVVVETMYLAYGSKAELFKAVVRAAVAGGADRAQVPVEQRPAIAAGDRRARPHRQLELSAATQPGGAAHAIWPGGHRPLRLRTPVIIRLAESLEQRFSCSSRSSWSGRASPASVDARVAASSRTSPSSRGGQAGHRLQVLAEPLVLAHLGSVATPRP